MAEKDIGSDPNHMMNNNMSRHQEIVELDYTDDEDDGGFRLMPTIIEDYESSDLFSYDIDGHVMSDVVYVVTWSSGNEEMSTASMDALVWTLGSYHLHESSLVYLLHVYPETRFIPTPLGRLPISQANTVHKESYLIQERCKRSQYLQKFRSLCSSSKVLFETVLIESDMEAKAILDLIPVLNIRKLVLGATKSSLRKLKKGCGGSLDQIVHNAPLYCDIKVICEGKEVSLQDQVTNEPISPSVTAASSREINFNTPNPPMQDDTNGCINCNFFKL